MAAPGPGRSNILGVKIVESFMHGQRAHVVGTEGAVGNERVGGFARDGLPLSFNEVASYGGATFP